MADPMTDTLSREQQEAGLHQLRRIVSQSAGYYFAGEVTPFAEEFKSLALEALTQLEGENAALREVLRDIRDDALAATAFDHGRHSHSASEEKAA